MFPARLRIAPALKLLFLTVLLTTGLSFCAFAEDAVLPPLALSCETDQMIYQVGDTATVRVYLERTDGVNGVYPPAQGYTGTAVGGFAYMNFGLTLLYQPTVLKYEDGVGNANTCKVTTGCYYNNEYYGSKMTGGIISFTLQQVNGPRLLLATYQFQVLDWTTAEQMITSVVNFGGVDGTEQGISYSTSPLVKFSVTTQAAAFAVTKKSAADLYSVTEVCQDRNPLTSDTAAAVYRSGALGGWTAGDAIIFTVQPQPGYILDEVRAGGSAADALTITPQDGVYTIPAQQSIGPLTIVLRTHADIQAFYTPLRSNVDDTVSFQPYALISGDKALLLLQLDAAQNWCFTGEWSGSAIFSIPAGMYPEHPECNFAALVSWGEISPADQNAQVELLRGRLSTGQLPCRQLTEDYDVNGCAGARLLDVQAAYDFYSRSRILWNPLDENLLKADVVRDGKLNWWDADQLLTWAKQALIN